MKICIHCGAEITDETTHCPICGNKTEIPPQKRGYDSYYEDVQPMDAEAKAKKTTRSGTGTIIGLILVGMVVVIGTCVAVLCFI